MTMQPTNGAALAGIRVIEVAHLIAGPSAGMMLRELGAEVIKVESLGGNRARALSRQGIFEAYNRGKKSVVLDLKSTEGAAAFRDLVAGADVLIEGAVPGSMVRLGLDYPRLAPLNPRLVHVAVSAFNMAGPDAPRAGLDALIQAECGLMSITGPDGGEPVKVGCQIIDASAGLAVAQAVLAALFQRERTGQGQSITTSLFDVGVFLQAGAVRDYLVSGEAQGRIGNSTGFGYPTDLFRCEDGYVQVTAYFEDRWRTLCDVLGAPGLAEDPRFATNATRVENRAELRAELGRIFATRRREEWIVPLQARGIACGVVRDHGEIVRRLGGSPASPLGPLEGEGEDRIVRLPYRGAGLGAGHVAARPPELGADTACVAVARV